MRPADGRTCSGDFLRAQRCAVRATGVGLFRRALADDGFAADQHRLGGFRLCLLDGRVNCRDTVPIHVANHTPAIGLKALRRIVRKPLFYFMFFRIDGNAVIVVQHDQLVQAEGAGQRAHLVRNAFHQATVTGKHIDAVVDDCVAVTIKFRCQQAFGKCHAHRVGEALSERAAGGFHARRDAVFGVARRFGMQLAKAF